MPPTVGHGRSRRSDEWEPQAALGSTDLAFSLTSATEDGINTNFVGSFFSRIERAYVGIHHRFSTKYLDWYVADLAWREDMRRMSNGWLTRSLVARALRRQTSRFLCGYRQGNKPPDLTWESDPATVGR